MNTLSMGFLEVDATVPASLLVLVHLRLVLGPSKSLEADVDTSGIWNLSPITFWAMAFITSLRSSAGIEGQSDTSAAWPITCLLFHECTHRVLHFELAMQRTCNLSAASSVGGSHFRQTLDIISSSRWSLTPLFVQILYFIHVLISLVVVTCEHMGIQLLDCFHPWLLWLSLLQFILQLIKHCFRRRSYIHIIGSLYPTVNIELFLPLLMYYWPDCQHLIQALLWYLW